MAGGRLRKQRASACASKKNEVAGNAGARKVAQAARKHRARRTLVRARSRKPRVRIVESQIVVSSICFLLAGARKVGSVDHS